MSKKLKLQKNSVIVITGPTASGKTDLATELAIELNTEIISADSRQIYKFMDICTAKPNSIQLSKVKHHIIGFLNPDVEYSAGKFVNDAIPIIEHLQNLEKIPIVSGGTYFYIKALFDGLFEENKNQDEIKRNEIRERLNKELENYGLKKLCQDLKEIDEDIYDRIELDNPHRVIRALEYYYSYGERLSEAQLNRNVNHAKYNPIYFAIDFPRAEFYERINTRCDLMWDEGIVKEYENLISLGYHNKLNSLNTVGYKEVQMYIEDKLSKDDALTEFKKNTRRYAKRQLTWLRKNDSINWIDYKSKNKKEIILNTLKNEI